MLVRYGNKMFQFYNCVEPNCSKDKGNLVSYFVYTMYNIPTKEYLKVKKVIPEYTEMTEEDEQHIEHDYNYEDYFSDSGWLPVSPEVNIGQSDIKGYTQTIVNVLIKEIGKYESILNDSQLEGQQESNEDQFELDLDFPDAE